MREKKRESLNPPFSPNHPPPHPRKNFLKKITSKKITPPNTNQYNHTSKKNPLKEDKKIKHFKLLCSLHPTFVNKFTPKLATLSSHHTFDSPPLICPLYLCSKGVLTMTLQDKANKSIE